jgi:hypothetical protein
MRAGPDIAQGGSPVDALVLLKEDHKTVAGLFIKA